jgi:transposase
MHKRGRDGEKRAAAEVVSVGIDVGAHELAVAVAEGDGGQQRTVPNTATGHRELLGWLLQRGKRLRVCLEASGNYWLDLALALSGRPEVEVCVVNPRRARRFAESLGERDKTDGVDARVLAEYGRRMQPAPWQPPSRSALQLRAIARAVAALTQIRVQQQNRLHALQAAQALPALVRRELERQLCDLERRVRRLRQAGRKLIAGDAELERCHGHLLSVPGIGEVSALSILAELATLPGSLDARQWVAYSGLDPRRYESGSSVARPPRISRSGNPRLRAALYMPALVAAQHDPHLRRFYQRHIAAGKEPLAALTAVMRKLLHGIHAMFRRAEDYCGGKLCPA